MMTDILLARLEAAAEGSRDLDDAVYNAIGCPGSGDPHHYAFLHGECPPRYTTSIDSAMTLVPKRACNISLSSYTGHGRDDWPRDAWMYNFMDQDQLMGERAAIEEIERWRKDLGNKTFSIFEQTFHGPPKITMEKAIAEHFVEFAGLGPTPALAICLGALKARHHED